MPTTDYATDIGLPDSESYESQPDAGPAAPGPDSKSLKSIFIGFAATVSIGLALASWYVGVRIVSADEVAVPDAAPSSVTTASANATLAPPTPQAPTPATAPPAAAQAMAHTPSLYLQVAVLGNKRDAIFVRSLVARGFRAQLQPLNEDDARIIIGPFSTHTEMKRAQHRLRSVGVLAIQTAY
jgi:cell division septation protein DedD